VELDSILARRANSRRWARTHSVTSWVAHELLRRPNQDWLSACHQPRWGRLRGAGAGWPATRSFYW